jgi:hypothetical protein
MLVKLGPHQGNLMSYGLRRAPWLSKYFDPTLCMKLTGESQSLNADQAILPSQTC